MKSFVIFFFLLSLHTACNGLKILAILPLSMKSHLKIGHAVVDSLVDAGHQITVMTSSQDQKSKDNYRVIQLPDFMDEMKEQDGNPMDFANLPLVLSFLMMPQFTYLVVNMFMEQKVLLDFMKKEDEKFDVCLIEVFNTEALLGLVEEYNCVLIGYTTFGAVLWVDDIFSNVSPPSYIPNPFLTYTDEMNFSQRLYNTAIGIFEWTIQNLIHLPLQRYLYNKYFPDAKRSMDEMHKNFSFIFTNHHVSFSTPRPYLPTIIEIGGIHVKPAKKLPQEFQDYLDSAKDGVILFSMGSYIDGTDWSGEHRQAFVRVFGKLKQKVIWRYSNETLPGNPGNIKIGSWLPQREILAHKNLKVFITHGGLLGTTEALIEGVPVLGIPIFGDQMMNMAKSVERGYGQQVLFSEFNETIFMESLNEVLNNPIYAENLKIASSRFKDRPMTPQQTVVYWTEYAHRHQGAKHLRSAGDELNWLQLNSYDVYAVIAAIFTAIVIVDLIILRAIIKRCFKKNVSSVKKKKN